ncbi:MAG: TorF family putative porin, partial [Rubrivivax sp.]
PATLKYSHTVSKDYFGFGSGVDSGRNTGYLDLTANYPIAPSLTLNGHIGYTRFSKDLRDNVMLPNYYDYKVGVTYELGSGFSIAGAVVGANKKDFFGDVNKTRVIATLTKSL